MTTVIVFGPTGNVGEQTALAARKRGAQVVLAMRDTSKALSTELTAQEQAGGFTRVKADLTQPETLSAAVKSTGATRAYIYNVFGISDFMKSALEALKSAGIQFVVFLSSVSVQANPEDVPQAEFLAWVHAQVEINLDAVFGRGNWACLRPGFFITNLLVWHAASWPNGPVKLYNPGYILDSITPEDIGAVGGAILVNGLQNDEHAVTLHGPEALTQRETIEKVGQVLGRTLDIQEVDKDEATQRLVDQHLPQAVAEQLTTGLAPPRTGWEWLSDYKQGVANVELYAGRPGVTIEQWVGKNKQLFS